MTKAKEMVGKQVKVNTFGYVFEGTVADASDRINVIWVERQEDNEWLYIDLDHPKNTVEVIKTIEVIETEAPVEKQSPSFEIVDYKSIREIRQEIDSVLNWVEADDNAVVKVKVFDSDDSGEQTYDVEINYYFNDEYQDGFINQTFIGGEQAKKQAIKRAKTVLQSVKKWFEHDDMVEVEDNVELYWA